MKRHLEHHGEVSSSDVKRPRLQEEDTRSEDARPSSTVRVAIRLPEFPQEREYEKVITKSKSSCQQCQTGGHSSLLPVCPDELDKIVNEEEGDEEDDEVTFKEVIKDEEKQVVQVTATPFSAQPGQRMGKAVNARARELAGRRRLQFV